MTWVAVAIGGGAIVGGLLSSNAATSAANTQAQSAQNAAQMQLNEFNTINQQQAPWRQAGQNALSQLGATQSTWTKPFTAQDLQSNLAPNYDFMLQQGLGQAQNQFNASGGLVGGNAMQGLNTFAQNYAQNAYQNAFNNWQTNQTNIYNRLANIAGLGQTAANTLASAGTQLTGQAANYLTSGAAAQAAGQVGSANALSSGLQGAGNAYLLSSLLGSGSNPYASQTGGWAPGA